MTRVLMHLLLAASMLAIAATPASAQTATFEADAQEYTRLAVMYEQLLLELNDRKIGPLEAAELDRLRAQADAIKARHAFGREGAVHAQAFENRLRELSADGQDGFSKEHPEARIYRAQRRIREASFVVALAVLAVPLIYLMWSSGSSRRSRPPASGDMNSFRLPASLERIEVFGKRYFLELTCARIKDREDGAETAAEQPPVQGEPHESSARTWNDPDRITPGRTKTLHRYRLETADGHESDVTFAGHPSNYHAGQLFSMVTRDGGILHYYNHTTDDFGSKDKGIAAAHAVPGLWLWAGCMVVAAGGFLAAYFAFATPGLGDADPFRSTMLWTKITVTAVLAAIYVRVLRSVVQRYRDRQYKTRWEPQIKAFMQQCTPALQRRFSGGGGT